MNNINAFTISSFNYFKVDGRLDVDNLVSLQQEIDKLMKFGSKHFLFDLSKLEYINSSALRIFIKTQKQLKLVDGFLLILSPPKNIIDLLEMSDLSSLLKLKNNFVEAIQEFKI